MIPRATPLRDRGLNSPAPRYVPGPLAEGQARVVLSSATCEEPAEFRLYDEWPTLVEPYRVFDLPAGQVERWRQVQAAFDAMQEEIEALISARSAQIATRAGHSSHSATP